jgi:site-specific DNA recombinase
VEGEGGCSHIFGLCVLTEPSDVGSPVSLLLSRLVPMQMKRRGVEMRIVLQRDSTPNRVDLPLLKAVARARRWADELASGKARSVGELARREGIDGRSVRRLIPLGFLAPRIIEAIAEGRQPPELPSKL